MAARTKPPFRADHVGSLLRPKELLKAREDYEAGRIPAAELRALEDEAVRKVVKMQEHIGLQGITDGAGGFEPLRFVPKEKMVVLGLVTTKKPQLESKDMLKRRIEEAAKFVPLEQLCLSPQCGFASTSEGNALTIDEQIAKLRLVVEAAREVWG